MKTIYLQIGFSIGLAITACAQNAVTTEKETPDNNQASTTMDMASKETKDETGSNDLRQKLILAQQKTKELFEAVEQRGLIVAGKTESALSAEIVALAKELFGMQEHWHKKIVRAGVNTLQPYRADPPDRIIQKDDIVFLDFGPNFEGWETDLGRTYVLGNNPLKQKMKRDVEAAWREANAWYAKQSSLTGADYFNYVAGLAKRYGYEFGGDIAGHIIGRFPHEQPNPMDLSLDVHPDNPRSILLLDKQGNKRHWVLEIQFVDRANGIGGFYEDLLDER
jgi:Xaa-Pro aminopeptidase